MKIEDIPGAWEPALEILKIVKSLSRDEALGACISAITTLAYINGMPIEALVECLTGSARLTYQELEKADI